MAKELTVVENYNGHEIKHIAFANWFTVFLPGRYGGKEMHHFDDIDGAKQFIDEIEKNKPKFWWMEGNNA